MILQDNKLKSLSRAGNVCYIIGSGPSIQDMTIAERNVIEQSYVIAVNWSFIILSHVDVYAFMDRSIEVVLRQFHFKSFFAFQQHYGCIFLSPLFPDDVKPFIFEKGTGFKEGVINIGINSGYMALNFALHKKNKFNKIVLVGFDGGIAHSFYQGPNYHADGVDKNIHIDHINKDFQDHRDRIINLRGSRSLRYRRIESLKEF